LLRLPEPLSGNFGVQLQKALEANGVQLMACGSCALWQPAAAKTDDGLPAGRCMWEASRQDAGANISVGDACAPNTLATKKVATSTLTVQSLLALDCSRWRAADGAGAQQPSEEPVVLEPMTKRAERESDARWSWWGRLRRRWAGSAATTDKLSAVTTANWEDQIVERSGVGAGTEPCFACQGRIANLGALAVASPEGDKQTFSVWRCRQCFTYYLNDWIDRWERTDSLETEETYYRLAPQEALEILAVIDGVVDAEHPARRHERGAERAWMLQFIGARPVLSHQIKQGR
jgi:hypothetical protein